ncbi:hypothetical protein [Citrobacter koseri]|uniref:hypothetical protein n=1 Tax=Citrobacter koseri TaxID=545 RepID=UPI001F2A9BB0
MKSTVETKICELVKLGHERAAELKASCGAVDARSLAQLISDLASQLDVQFARSNALAAENSGLKSFISQSCYSYDGDGSDVCDSYVNAEESPLFPKTPATEAFLAGVRNEAGARAVELFAQTLGSPYAVRDEKCYEDGFTRAIEIVRGAHAPRFAAQLRKGVQS